MKRHKRSTKYVYEMITHHLKEITNLIESGEMNDHQLKRLKQYRLGLRKRVKRLDACLYFECQMDVTKLELMVGQI